MTLDDIFRASTTLVAYSAPAATARVCWQVALDRHLPKFGFPGMVHGGAAYAGSIILGVLAGLMALEVPKIAYLAHLLAASVGFYAQDVATLAITQGRQAAKRPNRIIRILKRLLK